MKKRIALLLSVLLLAAAFSACAPQKTAQAVRIVTLMGPTGMGMAEMMTDSSLQDAYSFSVASAPDQAAAAVISGEADIAAVPVNLAAVLYQKTQGNVQLAAVNTLGVLYVLERGDSIRSVSDLKGQTLYATGQGSNPEYVLDALLRANGLEPQTDVEIVYLPEHAELAAQMTAGSVALGMLPEPNVTSVRLADPDVRIALDLTAEWDKVFDTKLVQGCIVVNKAFAQAQPDALQAFLERYEASVEFALTQPEEASLCIEQAGIVPKAAAAKAALPYCNLCFLTGDEMVQSVREMLQLLYDADPKSVGGAMPDEAFYRS